MKNLHNIPQIISEAKIVNHPIDFKWNRKKMEKLMDPLEGHKDLEIALSHINHKAAIGLTAALLEWVHWRFKGYTSPINDIEKRIEALWCSMYNPEQTKPLLFDLDLEIPTQGSINGPLWTAVMNVRMVDVKYRKGSYFLQTEILGLILLARHVTPRKKVFDKWFITIMTDLNRLFPCQYGYKNLDETDEAIYDSSNDPMICRAFFFDPEFVYTSENVENAIHDFIANLDQKANPFLQLSRKAS